MTQEEIREFNDVPYTNEEGDALIQELNDRTKHTVNGYNSIAELGAKVSSNETSITGKEDTTNKGSVNGYAELDASGKVPSAQIPAGADSVIEYANLAAFPVTGATNVIYIALDTNFTYRWGGTVYVVLDPSLALGETSTTAYRGDRGKTAYDHSQSAHAPSDATDDQTGAEIKLAYEAESNTNAFTDTEKTKLTGVETGATADQSDVEIKTAYENNSNTEAFTTSEQTKLSGIATAAEVNTIDSVTSGEPTGSDQVSNVVSLTQAEYDAGTPVATTFYIITDA